MPPSLRTAEGGRRQEQCACAVLVSRRKLGELRELPTAGSCSSGTSEVERLVSQSGRTP